MKSVSEEVALEPSHIPQLTDNKMMILSTFLLLLLHSLPSPSNRRGWSCQSQGNPSKQPSCSCHVVFILCSFVSRPSLDAACCPNTTGSLWLPPVSDTSTRGWPSTTISALAGIGEVLDRRLVTPRLVPKHRNFVTEPMGRSVINVTSDESSGLDYEQLQESYHQHHHTTTTTTTTTSVSLQVGWLESLL